MSSFQDLFKDQQLRVSGTQRRPGGYEERDGGGMGRAITTKLGFIPLAVNCGHILQCSKPLFPAVKWPSAPPTHQRYKALFVSGSHTNSYKSYLATYEVIKHYHPHFMVEEIGLEFNGLDWSALKAKPIPYFILPRAWDAGGLIKCQLKESRRIGHTR